MVWPWPLCEDLYSFCHILSHFVMFQTQRKGKNGVKEGLQSKQWYGRGHLRGRCYRKYDEC